MSNPKKPTDVGPNRTGAGTSPIDSARLAKGAQTLTDNEDSPALFEQTRLELSQQAPPVGRMPPPATIKGAVKTTLTAAKGDKATVFIDKLGERLAFERTGTRLYDAILVKFDASHHDESRTGVSRSELEAIRTDELRHAGLLMRAIEKLGADPTAITPSADITAVASLGLVSALTDPRTTFTQALDVILIAELADTDGWTMLANLAAALGHDDLAAEFRIAEEEEARHVALVRRWLSRAIIGQATGVPAKGEQPSLST